MRIRLGWAGYAAQAAVRSTSGVRPHKGGVMVPLHRDFSMEHRRHGDAVPYLSTPYSERIFSRGKEVIHSSHLALETQFSLI